MKTLSFLLFMSLLVSFSNISKAQQASGTIYYANGGSLKFSDIQSILGTCENGEDTFLKGLKVNYEGTWRLVPFNKIKEIRTLSHENTTHDYSNYIWTNNVTLEVTTKTGVITTSKYREISRVYVKFYDELSGEMQEKGIYWGNLDGSLNIKNIVFD